jgi:hypothetical protein
MKITVGSKSLLDINLKKLQPIIPWNLQEYNIQRPKFFFLVISYDLHSKIHEN